LNDAIISNTKNLNNKFKLQKLTRNFDYEVKESLVRTVQNLNHDIHNRDYSSPIWKLIQYEAFILSETDIKISSLMVNSVLSQPSFNDALLDLIANKLETPMLQATQIRNLFAEIFEKNRTITTSNEIVNILFKFF
jgi:hypothetical protein